MIKAERLACAAAVLTAWNWGDFSCRRLYEKFGVGYDLKLSNPKSMVHDIIPTNGNLAPVPFCLNIHPKLREILE